MSAFGSLAKYWLGAYTTRSVGSSRSAADAAVLYRFDKGEVIRNIGVERRQVQLDGLRFVLPVSERLLVNLIHLIRRIDKVSRLVMRPRG